MHGVLGRAWSTLLVIMLIATAAAVGLQAGTKILNQGSITYKDASGKSYSATSNVVETIVRQVYGFVIKPDGTEADPGQLEAESPGETALFRYTVTNTGNGVDVIENLGVTQGANDDYDFTQTRVYLDSNCNGEIDPGEAEVTEVTLDADESACLIVAAEIPQNAQDDDYGNLNLSGTSRGDPSLDPDGNGTAGDDNNWARAVSSSGGILDVRKSASPTGYVSPGDVITYTLQGENSGRGPAGPVNDVVTIDGSSRNGIFIEDSVPEHTTYLPGSMSGSSDDGEIAFVWKTGGVWTASEPAAAEVQAVGCLITGGAAFFAPDASYDLSFKVTVDSDVTPSDEVHNEAHLRYDGNGDGVADSPAVTNDDAESRDSNPTVHKIRPAYDVWVGPSGDADSDGSGFTPTYSDPSGKTWTYDETTDTAGGRNDDLEALTSPVVHTGETVYFRNSVMNRGNSEDSFALSVDSAPEGWACRILDEDGATPINGAVGPLAPGESENFVVACTIPSGNEYAEKDPGVFNDVVIRATSEGDPSKHNLTTDRVADVEPELSLDLADHGQSGDSDPADDDPAGRSSAPGATIDYPLDVTNTGSRPDAYTYSAELPPGWTVTYYADEDCNGVADQPEESVTETLQLDPGERACYVARVTVAPEEQPGDFNLGFHVTSKADPTLSDTVHTPVQIVIAVQLDIQKDVSQGSVQVGDVLTYTLTLVSRNSVPLNTTVSDHPDTHLRYVPGSTRSDCDLPESEPQVMPGSLVWSNLTMAAGERVSCQISYRMRVLPGATNPVGNTVQAEGVGAGGLVSDSSESHAEVLLAAGVFQNRRGTITGRVYLDTDGDGAYRRGVDVPLPGARVILENGRQVLTDGEGRYAFRDVDWGVWQVMLDDDCNAYEPEPHPETVDGKGFRHRLRVEGLTVSDFPLAGPGGGIEAVRKTWVDYGPLSVEKELIRLSGVTRVVIRLHSDTILPQATLRDPLPDGSIKEFDLTGLKGERTISYDLKGLVPMTDPTVDWRTK